MSEIVLQQVILNHTHIELQKKEKSSSYKLRLIIVKTVNVTFSVPIFYQIKNRYP